MDLLGLADDEGVLVLENHRRAGAAIDVPRLRGDDFLDQFDKLLALIVIERQRGGTAAKIVAPTLDLGEETARAAVAAVAGKDADDAGTADFLPRLGCDGTLEQLGERFGMVGASDRLDRQTAAALREEGGVRWMRRNRHRGLGGNRFRVGPQFGGGPLKSPDKAIL